MNDLWLRVCAYFQVDPATVRMPRIFVTSPDMIYVFSGDRNSYGPALYYSQTNTVLAVPSYDRGHIIHEFAEAIVYQSKKFDFKDTEDFAKWAEQNV